MPAPPSLTRTAIARISAGPCRSVLAPHGFRRAAPNFWRLVDGLSQCVNFQASAWGSHEAGRFTINLGVSSPALFEGFLGRPFPARPVATLWPIHVRIGSLVPTDTDLWWNVDEHTDVAALGDLVAGVLQEHAVPWFEALSTRIAFVAAIDGGATGLGLFRPQVPLVRAILAAEDGDRARAQSLLTEALEAWRGQGFEQTVRRVADRLAIALDDQPLQA